MPLFLISSIFGTFFCLAQPTNAKDLNELNINELAKSSPNWEAIEAESESQRASALASQNKHQIYGFATYGFEKSNEESLTIYSPIFDRARSANIGFKKKLRYGLNAEISAYNESVSITEYGINKINRTGARIKLEMDLFSNFLGRIDNSIYMQANLNKKIANLYEAYNKKKFILDIYKLYWAHVTTKESKELTENMITTAEKQAQEMKRQRQLGAADKGDLAQALSLVSTRKNQLKLMQFQLGGIKTSIRKLIPDVNQISKPNLKERVPQALFCINQIAASEKMPKSSLLEVSNLLKKEKKYALKESKATNNIDLKLSSEYRTNAVGTGFSNSYENFTSNGQDAYNLMFSLSIPLGGKKYDLRQSKERLAAKRFESEARRIQIELKETHRAAKSNVLLLLEALKQQEESVKNLNISLKSTRSKFKQARVSLRDYINEQDKYFSSKLGELEIRLQIIDEIFSYYQIFDHFDCNFLPSERIRS